MRGTCIDSDRRAMFGRCQSEITENAHGRTRIRAVGHRVRKLRTIAATASGFSHAGNAGIRRNWSCRHCLGLDLDSMEPAADVIAAGAPMDINLSKIAAGQQIIVLWRGNPILIVNRTPSALKTLQDPHLVTLLSDPNSEAHQQPAYAENWHRSIKPEFAVLVGIVHASWLLTGVLAAA